MYSAKNYINAIQRKNLQSYIGTKIMYSISKFLFKNLMLIKLTKKFVNLERVIKYKFIQIIVQVS